MLRKRWKRFLHDLGPDWIGPRRYGEWCIPNLIWNTMPWDRQASRRFKMQYWLYEKLAPILNPERTFPKGGTK